MLKLSKVAVTGGLSCGKSSACRIFKELGAYVVSADEIVHRLLSPTTSLGQQVIKLIGPDIVINQKIDRSQIAKRVFNQPELLQKLENLLHPKVREEVEIEYQKVKKQRLAPLFIAEIPLLFETGAEKNFDYTIVIVADELICQQRFKQAGYDEKEYHKRMSRQLNIEEKIQRADYVVTNNGSEEQLYQAIKTLYYELINPNI